MVIEASNLIRTLSLNAKGSNFVFKGFDRLRSVSLG